MNDWEIAKVITELDKINQMKINDHTPLHQALADIYEAPWEDSIRQKSAKTGINLTHSSQFYGGNPQLRVTEISKSLKTMVKDFDCPVLCLI